MDENGGSTRSASPEPLLRRLPRSAPARRNRLVTLLGRAAGRRGPPAMVRETAAWQLEERRTDWAYSRPVVALDISWNLAFAVVSISLLVATTRERPNVPLRPWIAGYALQCLLHVALVWSGTGRRRGAGSLSDIDEESGAASLQEDFSPVDSGEDSDDSRAAGRSPQASFAKRCESLNTMTSFVWWIVGFYWLISGGELLVQNAPRLYWLAVVFLAFDVCFAIFCVALAFVIGVALCCCLPCIIALLYAFAGQEGASEADISLLPRYRYDSSSLEGEKKAEMGLMVPIMDGSRSFVEEQVMTPEYAECCICLSSYEDGNELHALPCGHHFHAACVAKWLKINATCPLCKRNILKSSDCV
ncbi:hypothetical protein HPP92_019870 [Vanilla planifolia]|uniref:RING-type E3 ubiquitin transferase n=1 Tax=Vanilla planifolia TaxID=51239 RepID=A0A835Q116_VANPL|nr:hypothetical protein HPP92_020309 [Vanilla planifolia]KAG0465706.1 hypothetical protein HPP92_019870 [Vanilla planifolia]